MQEYLNIILRLLCLVASNFGYYHLLRKKTRLHISYLPIVTIGIQCTILFCAGILNVLLITSIVMLVAGIVLFVCDVLQKKLKEYGEFLTPCYGYMAACLTVLLFLLHGSRFYEFDDFSHWATVVQEMLGSNAYPNFTNWAVSFQSYPLATASYIYYGCLVMGTAESTQMLIQDFMIICAIMPLFGCAKKHRMAAFFYLLLFTNFIFVYNIPINTLVVDSLLPVFGMGTFVIAWNIYKTSQTSESAFHQLDIWVTAPLMVTTVTIKNSGVFFALPAMFVLLAMMVKSRREKAWYASVMLTPAVTLILWQQHCRYVFSEAMFGKHAMSFENYAMTYSEKNAADIQHIAWNLLGYLVVHPAFWCILFLTLTIVVASCIFNKKDIRKSVKFFFMILFFYLLYIVGVFAMYIFSMPGVEAKYIYEVSRYVGTMDIAAFYLITAYVLDAIDDFRVKKTAIATFFAVFAVLIFLWGGLTQWNFISGNKYPLPRMLIDKRIEEYHIPIGTSCAIANSVDDADEYLYNITYYLLLSNAIYQVDDFEKNLDDLKSLDYIIMIDYENEKLNQWLQNHYPEQYGKEVIVIN